MRFTHRIVILLLILITACDLKQVILTKENQNYVLKLDIANLKINLDPVLSLQNKHSWIKSQNCKYCTLIDQTANQQNEQLNNKNHVKYQQKLYDCSKSCFDKSQQQYGLKCIETHKKCQIINENVQFLFDQKIMRGKLVKVKGQASQNNEKFDQIQVVLVDQIFSTQSKGKKNQLTKEQQPIKNTKKPQEESNKIGQFHIWGKQTLLENNILTKNSKGEIIIYDSIKKNKLQKQLLQNLLPIDIEFQQSMTEFSLSQIKISEKITLNHPEKQTQDKEFPILPLQKGFFTLETENLFLPKKQYQKLTKYIIQTYFSEQKNKCDIKGQQLSCEKEITFDKVQYLQLELILNGISVGFPFKSLLKNYKGKTCQIRLAQTQAMFAIGTFFFQIFAVEFLKQTQDLRLYRLDNQWNKFYSKDQKYHKENFNIFWWMGTSVFYLIYYVVKIIFYLALFSLLINFIYHWRKILDWMGKIVTKITSKKGQGQLFEQDQQFQPKDTAKLIKKFKNRPQKVFIEDHPQIGDQITTQQSN